jgi:hypothetical protein
MVMMTGATAGREGGAETWVAGVTAGKLLCCWVAQVSKQRKRAELSSARALHCNQPSAGDDATGLIEFWPLAQVDKALKATKKRVNLIFMTA